MIGIAKAWPVACLLLAAFLVACADPAQAPVVSAPSASGATPRVKPLVGVHYFGNAWPMNFIAGFRRADVPDDFRRIADDGFDSVVLLVSWGDFQPIFSPCCQYDERAWERLHFLLDQARLAKLQVVLRVGYAWTYQPMAGDSSERVRRLIGEPGTRAAYLAFVKRLADEIADKPEVALTFMSWEDQWLRNIDESARGDFQEFARTRTDANMFLTGGAPLPTATGDQAELFNAYWDWLVIEKIYRPAVLDLPSLSYEARVDMEPHYTTGPDGVRKIDRWLGHDGMLRQRPGHPVTVYWAPFWGARNEGEKLAAVQSLTLLQALLSNVRDHTHGQPIFIDQFNVVDNSLGHEANAALASDDIAPFLEGAVCTLKANNVIGYAFWTGQDYAENPLFNPAFGYGLDGWTWLGPGEGRNGLEALPMGDWQLRLRAGNGILQRITVSRGRVPTADNRADRTCVAADVAQPTRLLIRAGDSVASTLDFPATGLQTQCAAFAPVAADGVLDFSLEVSRGELALQDVQIFDHIQHGGLYDEKGRAGPLLPAVRKMNRDFRAESLPARCVVAPVGKVAD